MGCDRMRYGPRERKSVVLHICYIACNAPPPSGYSGEMTMY